MYKEVVFEYIVKVITHIAFQITNALGEYGLTGLRDVIVNELDDYTSVHANVWLAEMSSELSHSRS